jgi:heat shock protein HtpX
MVYEDIADNKRSTFFLMFFVSLIIMGLGYIISLLYGGNPYYWVGGAAVLAFFMSFFSYYYSDSIVIMVTGVIAADPNIHRQFFISAEGLSLAAGLPMPKLFIIPGNHINAFATGRDPQHAVIAVTEGALVKLDKFELEGVIAHEMSHVKNYDILVGTVAAVLVGMVVIISDMMRRSMFYSSLTRRRGSGNAGIVIIIIAILASIIAPLAAMLIRFAISREREYLADAQGVLLTRYPKGLIGALMKIKGETYPEEEINRGVQHLYFAFPQLATAEMFSTHPPIADRIARLSKM